MVAAFGSTNVSTARPRPFIARADSQGNFIWVRFTGALTTSARGAAVAFDPGGDLWFAGEFIGALEYDTNLFTSVYPPPLQNFTRSSAFVARLNRETGLPKWVQQYQGKGEVKEVRRIGSHPAGGALLVCNIVDSYFYPASDISVLNGPGLVLRIDDHGTPQAAFEGLRPVLDAAVNPRGATLLASQFSGEFYFGPTLFRSPNGQDQGAMLLLKPDLTLDLARSVTGLKGLEYTRIGRIALSPQGDALMSGSFSGTNVVFGPLVARAPVIFSAGAFLGRLAGSTAPAIPSLHAEINRTNLRLTWPPDGWILERVDALNGSFSSFAYTPTTNASDGRISVELPLHNLGSFFRLRGP